MRPLPLPHRQPMASKWMDRCIAALIALARRPGELIELGCGLSHAPDQHGAAIFRMGTMFESMDVGGRFHRALRAGNESSPLRRSELSLADGGFRNASEKVNIAGIPNDTIVVLSKETLDYTELRSRDLYVNRYCAGGVQFVDRYGTSIDPKDPSILSSSALNVKILTLHADK